MRFLAHALLFILLLPFPSSAIECPKIPEQTNKEWDVQVKAAVGRIGPVKGAELETRTRKAILDLMGKLPQADKVYLEQMMYATYCSAVRDDKTLSESEKADRIRAYNLEVRKTLFGPPEKPEGKPKSPPPADRRAEARVRLGQMSVAFTKEAFLRSVEDGDIDAVKLFLAAGMDPNAENEKGVRALSLAIRQKHHQVIDALLKAKASVNGGPLSYAATPDRKDILLVLLKQGPDPKSLNAAFVNAASCGDRDTMELLIKRGADIKASSNNESVKDLALKDVLFYDSLCDHHQVPEEIRNETVKFLLDLGAGVNAQCEFPNRQTATPLLLAVDRGHEAIARTLLERGADPNVRWKCPDCYLNGMTPLLLAARAKTATNIVKILLDKGADINAKLENSKTQEFASGTTALMIAVTKSADAAEVLISRNADFNMRNDEGESAFLRAAGSGYVSVKADNVMRRLINKGVDINQRDNGGNTALMYASSRLDVDMVRFLLDKGADATMKNNAGETALMSAARHAPATDLTSPMRRGYESLVDLVRALLDTGANINARTNEGKTALMMWAERGNIEVVKTLLERGANAIEKDLYGKTALDFAEKSGLTGEEKDRMFWMLKTAGDSRKQK